MRNIFNFDKPKTAIQWLVFLAAIGITLTSPAGTKVFLRELEKYVSKKVGDLGKGINSNNCLDARQLSQALYRLKKRKIIDIERDGDKTVLVLSEKGKKRKLQYDFDSLKVPKPKSWDKKWRLIMFDIPEKEKFAREAFREKLKNLGFLRFQKSVWVHPYPCENEIGLIAENFKIAPYITLLTVQIEDDRPLRARYSL